MSAHDNHDHASHGSVASYLVGFVLAAVLTIIPFWAVMAGNLSPLATGLTVGMGGSVMTIRRFLRV